MDKWVTIKWSGTQATGPEKVMKAEVARLEDRGFDVTVEDYAVAVAPVEVDG